jgi:hypothetical protein
VALAAPWPARDRAHLPEAYESHCARYAVDPEHVLLGLWGGNLSLPRGEFRNVTLVTEMALPRGQDDREWGLRLHKSGVRGRFDAALLARHGYDRSLAAFRRDCRVNGPRAACCTSSTPISSGRT